MENIFGTHETVRHATLVSDDDYSLTLLDEFAYLLEAAGKPLPISGVFAECRPALGSDKRTVTIKADKLINLVHHILLCYTIYSCTDAHNPGKVRRG